MSADNNVTDHATPVSVADQIDSILDGTPIDEAAPATPLIPRVSANLGAPEHVHTVITAPVVSSGSQSSSLPSLLATPQPPRASSQVGASTREEPPVAVTITDSAATTAPVHVWAPVWAFRATRWAWGGVSSTRSQVGYWLTLIAAFTVALVALRFWQAGQHAASAWRDGAALVVYLDADIEPASARAYAVELATQQGVVRADYVASEEAAVRLRRSLGGNAALLDDMTADAFPQSIEVVLAPGVRDVIMASPWFRAIQTTDGVEQVELVGVGRGDVNAQLTHNAAVATRVFLIVGAALGLIIIALVWQRPTTPAVAAARAVGAPRSFFAIGSAGAAALQVTIVLALAVALATLATLGVEGLAVANASTYARAVGWLWLFAMSVAATAGFCRGLQHA